MATLDAADLQLIAKIVHGVNGTVWHVTTAGNDTTGDGLTWASAYALPTKAASVASAGDVIICAPGTFALGNNVCNLPTGVSMIGAGIDRTWITSSADLTVKGCVVKPGTGSLVKGMTINGTNVSTSTGDWKYQGLIGFNVAASTPQTAFSYAVIEDIRCVGESDGIFLGEGGSPGTTNLIARNVTTRSQFDGFNVNAGTAWTGLTVDLHECTFVVVGPNYSGEDTYRAIATSINGVQIRAYNCHAIVSGGTIGLGSGYTAGIAADRGSIDAFNCFIQASATSGSVYDVYQFSNGTFNISQVNASTLKTFGTISFLPMPANIKQIASRTATASAPVVFPANVGTGTGGGGSDSCTINIKVSGVNIEGAQVWVTNDAVGADVEAGTLYTNASGNVTFLLTAGDTYYLWAKGPGMNSIKGQSFIAEAD